MRWAWGVKVNGLKAKRLATAHDLIIQMKKPSAVPGPAPRIAWPVAARMAANDAAAIPAAAR